MAQLRQDYDQFQERNILVAVLGPEKAKAFSTYWEEEKLPYIGLPDPRYKVLKLYGQQFKIIKFGRMPAQVAVDMAGMVRHAHYGNSMDDVTPNEDVLGLFS